MQQVPRGYLAVGALVVLTCGALLWQTITLSPHSSPASALSPTAPSDESAESPVLNATSQESSEIVVHVAGAVNKPGVVRIPRGSRVDDAIKAAGGFSAQADPDFINLAQPLEDGVQVYVPRKGESVEVRGRIGSASAQTAPQRSQTNGSEVPSGKININSATAEELESLPGIGPVTARAIVEYRKQNGGFSSVDELLAVHGIGAKRLEQIRPFVVVR